MLKRVDRLQMVVPDRAKAAAGWAGVLGAEPESEDRIKCLGAERSTWRAGSSRIEFLSPDGAGKVQDALSARGAHLFAAGLATEDFDGLMAHLGTRGVKPVIEAGQAFLDGAATGGFGMQVVISPESDLPAVGNIDFFYETTLLVHDAPARVAECAKLFGLDMDNFVPIGSADYGYEGTLTLFRNGHLDRFEIITPTVAEKTMGRYFARFGQGYYMAFAESGSLPAIEETLKAAGLGHTVEPYDGPSGRIADTIFVHPPVLGGMMLGISRRTKAWQWSGHPDWVEEPK